MHWNGHRILYVALCWCRWLLSGLHCGCFTPLSIELSWKQVNVSSWSNANEAALAWVVTTLHVTFSFSVGQSVRLMPQILAIIQPCLHGISCTVCFSRGQWGITGETTQPHWKVVGYKIGIREAPSMFCETSILLQKRIKGISDFSMCLSFSSFISTLLTPTQQLPVVYALW